MLLGEDSLEELKKHGMAYRTLQLVQAAVEAEKMERLNDGQPQSYEKNQTDVKKIERATINDIKAFFGNAIIIQNDNNSG